MKNYIINNPEYIEIILEEYGFHKITKRYDEYRCAREEGRNPTSIRVNIHTLSSTCFSTNLKGDLITLVQSKTYKSFPKTIEDIAKLIGFKNENKIEEYVLPFSGFYKKIAKLREEESFDINIYSDDILNKYENSPNLMFLKDGILPDVQRKFRIGYDSVTNRITIPWFTSKGLVGVVGRLYKKELADDDIKYYPLYPFPKSLALYGFVENYHSILEKSFVIVSESEKATMQLTSKGLDIGVSLGGSFISDFQEKQIKSLFPKKIIVAMDEGLSIDHSIEIARKLKSEKFYKNSVGYIWDKNNDYLPKNSKLAPADLNKHSLRKLIENCTVWI